MAPSHPTRAFQPTKRSECPSEEVPTNRWTRSRWRTITFAVCCASLLVAGVPGAALALAPTTSILTEPTIPGASGWYSVAPLVTLSSTQDGVVSWSWDGGVATTASVTAHILRPIPTAPEGEHSLSAWCVNLGGETESPVVTRSLRVDSGAPSPPGSPDATVTLGVGVRLTWTASEDTGSGLWRYAVYRRSGAPPFIPTTDVIAYTTETTFVDFPPAFTGEYAYAVSAFDVAGNESALSEFVVSSTHFNVPAPVYRFYNFRQGVHFYTASETERANVIATLGGTYRLEGVAYRVNTANPSNRTPLYRFYNFRNGVHFYTASETEKANVVATLGSTYRLEGVAYYLAP
jgi:hypothetical protein